MNHWSWKVSLVVCCQWKCVKLSEFIKYVRSTKGLIWLERMYPLYFIIVFYQKILIRGQRWFTMSKQIVHSVKLIIPTLFIMRSVTLRHLFSGKININILDLWSDRTKKVLGQCPHLDMRKRRSRDVKLITLILWW